MKIIVLVIVGVIGVGAFISNEGDSDTAQGDEPKTTFYAIDSPARGTAPRAPGTSSQSNLRTIILEARKHDLDASHGGHSHGWYDHVNGTWIYSEDELELFPVIPIVWAVANRGGAWTDVEKESFSREETNLLLARKGSTKERAGRPPMDWLPKNPDFQCRYVEGWHYVANEHNLQFSMAANANPDRLEGCLASR